MGDGGEWGMGKFWGWGRRADLGLICLGGHGGWGVWVGA